MVQNFDGNAYDVVIGSGLSGLTAAAYLARAGHRVVVLEQAQSAGGFAHAFRRGDYILDPALHYTQEVKDDEVVGVMLRQLGIRDQLQFLEGDYHYQVRFPDFSLCVPVGAQNLIEAHVNRFPRCADGIRKFFRLCGQMHAEAHDVPMQAGLKGLDELARQFPILFKYQRATLAEVLEEFVDDPHARAACCAAWPWLGLPPSTCSFLTFAQLLSVMIQGTYFCVGGFQVVVDAMVAAIEEKGGTFLLGQAAKQILLREGKVVGVCTQDGTEIPARSVIATGSARLMYRDMVGYDHLPPGFVRRLERMEPSVSAFIVFAATDADLGARGLPPEVFLYGSWDQDENFGETMADKPEAFWLSIPTVIDPSLAPPGKHIVACTVVADFRHDPP